MIISDDGFFRELADNRICTITGRLGNGKTLLALDLSRHFLERGYSLVTNTKTVWNDDPQDVLRRAIERSAQKERGYEKSGLRDRKIAPQVRAVSIVDEGGLYARSDKVAMSLANFARKTDQIIIFSGKKLPHSLLCDLQVVMWFDFQKNFLVPLKVWEWSYRLNARKSYQGKLLQIHWKDLYGVYSTFDPASDAKEVINFSIKAAEIIFQKYGRKYVFQDMEGKSNEETADAMGELTQALVNVVDGQNSSVQTGGRGRRRK